MVVILKGYNDAPLDQVAHLGEALAGVPVPEFWMSSTRTRSTGRLGGTADATARRNNDGEDREGVRHHARGAIAPLRANVMWNTCLGQFRVQVGHAHDLIAEQFHEWSTGSSAEADRAKAAGTLGAFMREKHVYSSMLSSWRRQLGASERVALAPQRRGPKPDASARQVLQLTRDNARLRRKLERAKLIIDAQKKLRVALGLPTSDDRTDEE